MMKFYGLKLSENFISRTTTVGDELISNLDHDIFDNIDINLTCSWSGHQESREIMSDWFSVFVTDWKGFEKRKWKKVWRRRRRCVSGFRVCDGWGRRREKGIWEREKETRGGRERKNKEKNINRFASDYNHRPPTCLYYTFRILFYYTLYILSPKSHTPHSFGPFFLSSSHLSWININ